MKPTHVIFIGALFILGIIIGYSIYAATDKYECQLRRNDIQNCIDQANQLLYIVVSGDYCAATYELPFNFTFELPGEYYNE